MKEDRTLAGNKCIAAVGRSLVTLLTGQLGANVTPVLARTEDFEKDNRTGVFGDKALSIYLYRVDFNKTMRAAWSAASQRDRRSHLPLDLHYLLTPWGKDAAHEHEILGSALQALETTSSLSGLLLDASGEFGPDETIQLVMEEISTEAVMRTFDSLPVDYRLSVPYIARVARLDGPLIADGPPVVTAISGATPTTQL
ncbi:MAG: DUF4255 domain-containing protein [Blastocatellia bacterium]